MTPTQTSIGPATPQEREAAFRLMLRHCPEETLPQRLAAARRMLDTGELDPDGLLVLRRDGGVTAASAATLVPGGSGIVWPPCALETAHRLPDEDDLARAQLAWLRARGVRVVQGVLAPDETFLAAPLIRVGYRHVTSLWYLRHDREMSVGLLDPHDRLRWQTYAEADRALFLRTLQRTFEQTLDCPEVSECRSVEEIVVGFQAQGVFDPAAWWLARHDGEPAGVLLTCAVPGRDTWEVCYLGVVPELRRRGLGRELMIKALLEARAAEVLEVFLTVDARNRPAWDLYRSLGFEPFDCREVFLYLC